MIDLEDESIDTKILNSIVVSNDRFKAALNISNTYALHETVIGVPNISWDDIGGQSPRLLNASFKRQFNIRWNILNCLRNLACLLQRVSCFMACLNLEKLCWLRQS